MGAGVDGGVYDEGGESMADGDDDVGHGHSPLHRTIGSARLRQRT